MRVDSPADLRKLTVRYDLDHSRDQTVSRDEVAAVIGKYADKLSDEERRLSVMMGDLEPWEVYDYRNRGRYSSYDDDVPYKYQAIRSSEEYCDYLRGILDELRSAHRYLVDNGVQEMDLVSTEFRERFADQTPAERHALLKADVRGNNDGDLTLDEYEHYNGRSFPLFGKRRFQGKFGDEAHQRVLAALSRPTGGVKVGGR